MLLRLALEGAAGKKLNIQILKQPVEAKTRKLSARWTFESAQDAQSMHGIDVEAEIMAALAQEITAEIDQEVLTSLRSLAATEETFNQSAVSGTATYVGDEHAALAVLLTEQLIKLLKELDVVLVTGLWFLHKLLQYFNQHLLQRSQEQLKVHLKLQQTTSL